MVWFAVIRFCAGLLGCGFVVFGFVIAVCLCVGGWFGCRSSFFVAAWWFFGAFVWLVARVGLWVVMVVWLFVVWVSDFVCLGFCYVGMFLFIALDL